MLKISCCKDKKSSKLMEYDRRFKLLSSRLDVRNMVENGESTGLLSNIFLKPY
jgi:hypothetical protein